MKTIVTRSVTLHPPMASYCAPAQQARARAQREQPAQRWHRERAEALNLMAQNGFEPQPPAPEMPAKLALHQEQADPLLNHDFILGILTGALLMSSSMGLMFGGKP